MRFKLGLDPIIPEALIDDFKVKQYGHADGEDVFPIPDLENTLRKVCRRKL